jgi:hypothetical protein
MGKGDRRASSAKAAEALGGTVASKTGGTFSFGGCALPCTATVIASVTPYVNDRAVVFRNRPLPRYVRRQPSDSRPTHAAPPKGAASGYVDLFTWPRETEGRVCEAD